MSSGRCRLSAAVWLRTLSPAVMALTGCSFLHTEVGSPISAGEAQFTAGQTSYGEVLEQLGPPSKVTALPNGSAFLYEYIKARERQFGFNLRAINWLKLSIGRGHAQRQAMLVTFDERGIVRDWEATEWDEDLGGGTGIHLIVAVTETVDTSHLIDPAGQLSWGRSLLDPLPVVLNSRQNLEIGLAGLEQKGTPTAAGQHTLEMR